MKKKVLIVLMVTLSISSLFAQNKDKPSSKIALYAGADMGYSGSNLVSDIASGFYGGFEITPYFGIKPFTKVPGLSFEVAVQMDFMKRTDGDFTHDFTIISPQLLVAYNGSFGKIRPFIKAGAGININSGKQVFAYENYTSTEKIDATPSVSFVLNPGIEFQLTKLISLVGYGRFNFNLTDLSMNGNTLEKAVFIGTQSFGFGTKFNF